MFGSNRLPHPIFLCPFSRHAAVIINYHIIFVHSGFILLCFIVLLSFWFFSFHFLFYFHGYFPQTHSLHYWIIACPKMRSTLFHPSLIFSVFHHNQINAFRFILIILPCVCIFIHTTRLKIIYLKWIDLFSSQIFSNHSSHSFLGLQMDQSFFFPVLSHFSLECHLMDYCYALCCINSEHYTVFLKTHFLIVCPSFIGTEHATIASLWRAIFIHLLELFLKIIDVGQKHIKQTTKYK